MKVVILDGSTADGGVGAAAERAALKAGAVVARFPLAERRIAPCFGDFECWVRTPGVCRIADDGRDVARAVQAADLLVCVTPLLFGAYGVLLKQTLDRLLGLSHPFMLEGERLVRHRPRYARFPAILFVAVRVGDDAGDDNGDEQAAIFEAMACDNAAGLPAPANSTLFISLRERDWAARVAAAIDDGLAGRFAPPPEAHASAAELARTCAAGEAPWPLSLPRTATLFVGSPKPSGNSTSESLARGLAQGLMAGNVACRYVHAVAFASNGARAERALAAMRDCDLLVVAAPLYLGGLPSLTMRALELLAPRLAADGSPRPRLAAILNCGYPEAERNRTALRVLREFARHSGLVWAGGVAMGGGGQLAGRPLAEAPLAMRSQQQALATAATDLAAGLPISAAAIAGMAQPLVSARIFRWMAPIRWAVEARKHGVCWHEMGARPFDELSD